jgi:hypothetical protein
MKTIRTAFAIAVLFATAAALGQTSVAAKIPAGAPLATYAPMPTLSPAEQSEVKGMLNLVNVNAKIAKGPNVPTNNATEKARLQAQFDTLLTGIRLRHNIPSTWTFDRIHLVFNAPKTTAH